MEFLPKVYRVPVAEFLAEQA
ncbi:hypothetical protein [Brevibacillus laterosporus]